MHHARTGIAKGLSKIIADFIFNNRHWGNKRFVSNGNFDVFIGVDGVFAFDIANRCDTRKLTLCGIACERASFASDGFFNTFERCC